MLLSKCYKNNIFTKYKIFKKCLVNEFNLKIEISRFLLR